MGLVRSIAARFYQFANWNSRSEKIPPDPRHELGREGERLAAVYLRRHGYKVLYRNFRSPHGGELDIVCREVKFDTLVFVEVKTRASLEMGRPAEAVDADKQRLISRGALAWLRLLGNPDVRFRFDVVEIIGVGGAYEVNLIKGAFTLSEPYRY